MIFVAVFSWEAIFMLIGIIASAASFMFKAGEMKANFSKEIQRLENIIDKTNITENATNQSLRYKLENLESRHDLEIMRLTANFNKELEELKKLYNGLYIKSRNIENFLTKTTSFNRRDTQH